MLIMECVKAKIYHPYFTGCPAKVGRILIVQSYNDLCFSVKKKKRLTIAIIKYVSEVIFSYVISQRK